MPPGSWHLLCLCTRSQEFLLRLVDRSCSTKPPQRTEMRADLRLSSHAPKRTSKARLPRSSTVPVVSSVGRSISSSSHPNNLNSDASSSLQAVIRSHLGGVILHRSHDSPQPRSRHPRGELVPASSGRVIESLGFDPWTLRHELNKKKQTPQRRGKQLLPPISVHD